MFLYLWLFNCAKMEIKLFILSILCIFIAGCTGLDRLQPDTQSETHVSTFKKLYPKSSHMEWEYENGLIKVELRDGRYEKTAWFLADGTWVKTVTEIPLSEVPAAVISALKNRLGNAWEIDDIDLVEQKDAPTIFYLAECEKRIGGTDIYIKLAEDGTFLNENEWKMFVEEQQGNNGGNNQNNGNGSNNGNSGNGDSGNGDNSQGSPLASFNAMFPNAWDVEWENERGMVKVEFKIGYREKEAWFLADGTWVKTVTEIPLSEVPAAVISALKNRLGNAWEIDDIDLVEQKDAPTIFYLAECEKRVGKQEIHLRVTPDGTIL